MKPKRSATFQLVAIWCEWNVQPPLIFPSILQLPHLRWHTITPPSKGDDWTGGLLNGCFGFNSDCKWRGLLIFSCRWRRGVCFCVLLVRKSSTHSPFLCIRIETRRHHHYTRVFLYVCGCVWASESFYIQLYILPLHWKLECGGEGCWCGGVDKLSCAFWSIVPPCPQQLRCPK